MRRNLLPGLNRSPSSWGRLLLAAGLLLVFVQGLLQLYEVQDFFSPGRYQATKLTVIGGEYLKIGQALTSLQTQLPRLAMLQKTRGRPDQVPAARVSPCLPLRPSCSPDPAWQAALHAAKKKRVYAARKLNHLNKILQSMQQTLEAELSDLGPESSARKANLEKTLLRIQESRALWKIYNDSLQNLSVALNEIVGCNSSQPASPGPRNKER